MKTVPFWSDHYPCPPLPVAEALPERVDVAIVGSGYTGLNAARVLSEHGIKIAILEQHTAVWGASSRNGGMATPGLKQSIATIYRKYGSEKAHQFWRAALEAIDVLECVIQEENIACDWRRSGHVGLAYKPSHFESLRKSHKWLREEFGYDSHLISKDDLHNEIGSTAYHGGLMFENSGSVHPAKYGYGLAKAISARPGVFLCEQTRVDEIRRIKNGFELKTSQGMICADRVLLATNGYSGNLVPKVKRHIFPVGSYIVVTAPLSSDLQDRLSPKRRMYFDTKNFLAYFRLTPDGRMLWGGRNNLSTSLDLADSANRLQAEMIGVFPELRNVPITHTWTGQLGLTFDLMPHIGNIDGIDYAFGYGGHGLSIATYIGREIGRLMSGEISHSPFLEIPQQTMFFYRNKPWFIPLAALWYQLKDLVS